jgi:hypothetical protein
LPWDVEDWVGCHEGLAKVRAHWDGSVLCSASPCLLNYGCG